MKQSIRPVKTYGAAYVHRNLIWIISPWTKRDRIYANAYPVGTPASRMSSKKAVATVYLYRGQNGQIHAGNAGVDTDADRDALLRWFEGYVVAGPWTEGAPFSEIDWRLMVRHCNGVGNAPVVESMAAATVRRRTYSQVFGVKGTQYPPTEDMNRQLSAGNSVFAMTPWTTESFDSAPHISVGRDESEVTTIEPGPVEPAPAQPAPAGDTGTFDPDAMTHRDLVDLARKGHDAVDEISRIQRHRDRAIASRDNAENARDAAIAERDEAIKRASMTAPATTEVVTGDGTVEVEGVTLPTFEGDHGPARLDGYDLAAWQAKVSIGDFEATASAPQVAASIIAGDSVRLVGPPSVGKTSGIREVCAITGAKFFLVPCGEGATDLSLIAERVIDNGGQFVWRDGHITQAVRWAIDHPETLCICVLDEVDHLVPEVQSLLHGVLEGGTLCVNPEETLSIPSNMRFVATANTSGLGDVTGHHASAKVSDTAFTSRWNATYTVAYLPPEAETRLLVNAGAPVTEAEQAVRCATMTRTEGATVTQPVVLRQLLAWARACGRGEDPRSAWAWRVMTSTPEHDRPALRELTRTCFNW